MKKVLAFCGRCITESLTASTSSFVSFLLAVPLKTHNGELKYLMPVILFHACMKTGVFFLHGAVQVENPYRMLKRSIILALFASFFLLNEDPASGMFLFGAVLTGIALSPFSSLYRYVSETKKRTSDRPLWRSVVSTVIMILFAGWCLHTMNSSVFRFWCVYLGIICVYIVFMPGREKYTQKKIVILKEKWFVHSVPTLLLFLMMAAVSGYKQSGNDFVFAVLLVSFALVIIWLRVFEDRQLFRYSAQTMWLGAVRGFEMLFALIYIANTEQANLTYVLYAVILASGFFTSLPDHMLRNCDAKKTLWICMAASLGCQLLVISRNLFLMFAGIFLCVSFTNAARNVNLNAYRNDGRVLRSEYIFRQDKMYSLGNGIMQGLTMIIFFLAGKITSGHGGTVMRFYVFNDPAEGIGATLLIGGILCVLLLSVSLAGIYRIRKNDNKISK